MIVILTVSDDVYVPDLVARAVADRGHDVVRVDSDEFASSGFCLSHVASGGDGGEFDLVVGGRVVDARRIWARRRWPGARSAVVDEFRSGAVAQSRALFHAWLRARGDDVTNAVDAEDRAEDKLLQLRTARRLGFTIPETLVSNDPQRVRAFVDEVTAGAGGGGSGGDGRGGVVVTKLLSPLSSSFHGSAGFFYTAVVAAGVMAHVDEVVHAPQIFQRRVDKVSELRVQVVGDAVFCGRLDVDTAERVAGVDDWRLQQTGRFERHRLSTETEARCRSLCRALGLDTGAIDLVVDGAGREHFLEINPAGEWGFLERDCQLPISNALAGLLTR